MKIMKMDPLKNLQSHRFIFLGVLLFLLGLIIGLAAPAFPNPRMGVSSHIEGVMNGMFLILLGLLWGRISLSPTWLKITFWLAVYGTFINCLGILVAAITDSGGMLNIMAEGKPGSPLSEGIVNFSLISLSVAMIVVSIAVLFGLQRDYKLKRTSS